jgi:DNA invertase Pin-like site-specific DNA recombinase
MDNKKIIESMGGVSAVAKLFNISRQAVHLWISNGIPDARLFSIKLLKPELFE